MIQVLLRGDQTPDLYSSDSGKQINDEGSIRIDITPDTADDSEAADATELELTLGSSLDLTLDQASKLMLMLSRVINDSTTYKTKPMLYSYRNTGLYRAVEERSVGKNVETAQPGYERRMSLLYEYASYLTDLDINNDDTEDLEVTDRADIFDDKE